MGGSTHARRRQSRLKLPRDGYVTTFSQALSAPPGRAHLHIARAPSNEPDSTRIRLALPAPRKSAIMKELKTLEKPGRAGVGIERAVCEIDRRLGMRVRARRFELGMSQERLSEMLGITFQQIQKYEKGANRIAASRLFDLAAALDVPVAYFFEGLSQDKTTGDDAGASLDAALAKPGAIELVRLFASIEDAAIRRRVLELVRAITTHP